MERDDREELKAWLRANVAGGGADASRRARQLAELNAMDADDTLETYEEAAVRLGHPANVTSGDVIALGIVRLRRTKP